MCISIHTYTHICIPTYPHPSKPPGVELVCLDINHRRQEIEKAGRLKGLGLGFRGLGFSGLGLRGLGFRGQGLGFRVQWSYGGYEKSCVTLSTWYLIRRKLWHHGIVPLKQIEYGVYGDLIIVYPKPDSIYLRGTINPKHYTKS